MTTRVERHSVILNLARALDEWLVANRVPLGVFFVTRFGIILAMYAGMLLLPVDMSGGQYRLFPDNLFLDGFVRWDSYYYKGIAELGYIHTPNADGFRDTSFFPMFPILAAAAGRLVGNTEIGGLIVSNAAFLVALMMLFHLVKRHYDEAIARRTTILLGVFPFSFFFSAFYTESVFAAAAIGAFFFGERRQWAAAAACAAVAGATRIVGAGVAVGLALLYLEQNGFRLRQIKRDVLWLLIAPLGIVFVMFLMWNATGNPLQFLAPENTAPFLPNFTLQKIADTLVNLDLQSFLAGQYAVMDLVHIAVLAAAVALALLSWTRLPRKSYTLWALLTIVLTLSAWPGFGRYVLPIFPVFITLALLLKHRSVYSVWLYLSVALLALFTIAFATWRWVA